MLRRILNFYVTTAMNGWLSYDVRPVKYLEVILLGIICYAVVAVIELRRIRRVPMDQALKNVE